jgi:hypothetical protein
VVRRSPFICLEIRTTKCIDTINRRSVCKVARVKLRENERSYGLPLPRTVAVQSGHQSSILQAPEESLTAGPLRSAGVTPPRRYYRPVRLPLAFGRVPSVPSYTAYLAPPISQRDEEGLSRCLARPCHHAVDNHPAGVSHRISLIAMSHAAFAAVVAGSASEAKIIEATSRSLALRPGDSPPSSRWRCR